MDMAKNKLPSSLLALEPWPARMCRAHYKGLLTWSSKLCLVGPVRPGLYPNTKGCIGTGDPPLWRFFSDLQRPRDPARDSQDHEPCAQEGDQRVVCNYPSSMPHWLNSSELTKPLTSHEFNSKAASSTSGSGQRGVAPQVVRMMVTTRLALAPRMDDPRRNCGAKRWPKSQDVHDEREARKWGDGRVGSQTFFRAFRETCANRLKFPMLEARYTSK